MRIITRGRRYDSLKHAMDVITASIGLILVAPILVVVGVMVAVNLGRPVIFKQDRPGRHAKVFRLYKFRTMKSIDPSQNLISDAQRLTRFGRALRASSLDELPTLLNVLKGDMSLIGPRPLLVSYLDRYTPEQARRHEVRPGITGLAQANGRNSLTWIEKFTLDVAYVDNRGVKLDLRILALTLKAVLAREGISSNGHATMDEFVGPGENR